MQNVYFLLRKLEAVVNDNQKNNMELFLHIVSEHYSGNVEYILSSNSIEDLYSSTQGMNEMFQCKMNIIVYIMWSI